MSKSGMVKLHDDTKAYLDSIALCDDESYNSIVERLIEVYKKHHKEA